MDGYGERDGWPAWRMVSRVASGAVSVPVVVGFVALGMVVVVARSLRDVARDAWTHLPGRTREPDTRRDSRPDAA